MSVVLALICAAHGFTLPAEEKATLAVNDRGEIAKEDTPLEQYQRNFAAKEKAAKDAEMEILHGGSGAAGIVEESLKDSSTPEEGHAAPKTPLQMKLDDLFAKEPLEETPLDPAERFKQVAAKVGANAEDLKVPALSLNDDERDVRLKALETAVSKSADDSEEDALHKHEATRMLETMEDDVLTKMEASVRMMAQLHLLMQPVQKNLVAELETMPVEQQPEARAALEHLQALDGFSQKAMALAQGVERSKGNQEEKQKAIAAMMEGMKEIRSGVTEHLGALAEPQPTVTSKLRSMMHRIGDRVAKELQDPHRQHDPMVQLDMEMYDTLQKAVGKSQALVHVASAALQEAKDDHEREEVKEYTKEGMKQQLAELKDHMQSLKMKAMVLSMAKVMAMKKHAHAHQEEDPMVAVGNHFESPDGVPDTPEPAEAKGTPVAADDAKAPPATPPEKTAGTSPVDPRSAAESDPAVTYDSKELKDEEEDGESLDELGNRVPHLRKQQHADLGK